MNGLAVVYQIMTVGGVVSQAYHDQISEFLIDFCTDFNHSVRGYSRQLHIAQSNNEN